jgi:hypothetical protein
MYQTLREDFLSAAWRNLREGVEVPRLDVLKTLGNDITRNTTAGLYPQIDGRLRPIPKD